MQRFTRIVALILALVTVFMVTVSADDFSNDVFINVLDYGTSDNGGNYIFTANAGTYNFSYNLPFRTTLSYVDMVINIAAGVVPDISVIDGSNVYSLTRVSLGNNMYRYYGSVRYQSYSSISLQYTVTSSTYFGIVKFDALTSRSTHFIETGYMRVTGGRLANTYSETMSSTSDVLTCTFPFNSEANFSFTAQFSCPDWRNYDYIDFVISGYCSSVDSVYASVNGIDIPLSLTYLDNMGGATSYKLVARLDLTGLDRTSTYTPTLGVRGFALNTNANSSSYIQLDSVNGFVVSDGLDPYNYWLRTIDASISSGFDTLIARQDAYQQDLQTWQQQHHQVISGLLQGISNGLTMMTNTLKDSIDSSGIYIVDTLSSFRISMESYLEELPVRIAEEISKIFKPTAGKFEAAKDESQELAEEKLGAVYQSAIVIDQIAGAFTNQTAQTSIVIPLVSVEVLPGVPFAFGGWDVPVVPSGLEFFVETLKFVIDIVCTLAFLNGMKRRLDGLFGGESGAD